jgi:class 3 adenylate cyclase
VDLCGFTAFADQHGDERVVLMLAEMRTTLRESAARRGVRIVKWLGDGAMLSSTMIDAVAGLVVELDIRMAGVIPSLPIRAGLSSGPVIMFEGDDYIGAPVNIAARLAAQARPHELLATTEVAAGRPSWVHAQEAKPVTVRGLAREVEVRSLCLCPPGDDPIVDPVCGLTIAREKAYAVDGDLWFCSEACAGSWLERPAAATF